MPEKARRARRARRPRRMGFRARGLALGHSEPAARGRPAPINLCALRVLRALRAFLGLPLETSQQARPEASRFGRAVQRGGLRGSLAILLAWVWGAPSMASMARESASSLSDLAAAGWNSAGIRTSL